MDEVDRSSRQTRPRRVSCSFCDTDELIVGHGGGVAPEFLAERLHGGLDAGGDIGVADDAAEFVVPFGEHAAEQVRIAGLQVEAGVGKAEDVWLPLLVKQACIEVVLVVASFGDDVEQGVVGVDERVALLLHRDRVGPAVVPVVNDDVVVDLDVALHFAQRAPHADSLTLAAQIGIVGVDELPVVVGVAGRVLVCADVHLFAVEPGQKLVPDGIHEGVGGGIAQVEILFRGVRAGKVGTILCEGQIMGRGIDFRRDCDAVCLGDVLQGADILLCVRAILCRQTWEARTVEPEGCVLVHPVGAVSATDGIVVEMQVQVIHLIPAHEFHEVFQVVEGEKLAPGIQHKAAFPVLRVISGDAPGDM